MTHKNTTTNRARSLRDSETKTEKLLWSVLRSKQVCNLKFRRQHPIDPFFADFACVSHKLVIEIDGGYHDFVADEDQSREQFLANEGWTVIRFTDVVSHNKLQGKSHAKRSQGREVLPD